MKATFNPYFDLCHFTTLSFSWVLQDLTVIMLSSFCHTGLYI